MLVLMIKPQESVKIGDNCTLKNEGPRDIRISFDAPKEIEIRRMKHRRIADELKTRKPEGND